MRIYTSYFYQIRFFTSNVIPLSTALWDPKWYHDHQDQSHIYKDKRGVLNGIRYVPLAPGHECSGECHGREECQYDPDNCLFLKHYRDQLDKIDFQQMLRDLKSLADSSAQTFNLKGDVSICLIVHEAPNNPCSERVVIQQWFKDANYPITEWSR